MTDPTVELGGLLGEAVAANRRGRLSTFIVDEHSPAIALFAPAHRDANVEGDWYGEHAGKWLVAASKAARHDATLAGHVRRVADFLVSVQEADGYLGTYAPARRFMRAQPPKPWSWNGEPSVRTWDVWTHAYLVLGLLQAHRALHEPRWLAAAEKIGDLCLATLQHIDITELGNHFGMSATVLMDPACELYFETGEARFLALARRVLGQAEAHAPLGLVAKACAGEDAAQIATGKAYQLVWNLVGLAKLHRATGEPALLDAVTKLWANIREHHLSLGGGPWGGVAHRSREVFNPAGAFSPQGYVETCSSLAWIQLNHELLRLSGDARFAQEIERTAYNDLLGAQAPDGEDWCYYVFPNGRRVHTTYWRCCKSSGAMAMEELPGIAFTIHAGMPSVNLLGPGRARFGDLWVEQLTRYPADDEIVLRVSAPTRLRVRIPAWATQATIEGFPVAAGQYAQIDFQSAGEVRLRVPMPVVLQRAANRNVQVSRAPDGSAVEQPVLQFDYVGMTRGPLAYATALIDGYKTEETVREPPAPRVVAASHADGIAALELAPPGRAPLRFEPYYRAGGREHGAWRIAWLSLAPQDAS